VPQAPTIGTATLSDQSASVTFTANGTGGSAITGYTVTSSPGSLTATGSSSPLTVSGLTGGTVYTFTVTATNASGTSAASAASNSVSPAAANYTLRLTANNTQNFTVPAGAQLMSAYIIGGGGSGNSGGSALQPGGTGGRAASAVAFEEFAVTPGDVYVVTVGSAGGTSSLGSLATAPTNTTASSNVA
jgi:hypothetical protein